MNNPFEQTYSRPDGDDIDSSIEASKRTVKGKGKGFFIVNLNLIYMMVNLGAGFEEVVAYMVLNRGSGRSREISTHGVNSIAERSGMTNTRAERALKWLKDHKFIVKAEVGEVKSKLRTPRFLLIGFPDLDVIDVALSNDLLDGVGRGKSNPPVSRIYNEVSMGTHCDIAHSKLDALMLLLSMYKHHEITDYCGVNPMVGLYREYQATENSSGNRIENIEGTNAALFEIVGNNSINCGAFMKEALFYVSDLQEQKERYKCAFINLQRLGLFYEVISVWNVDPIKNSNAYPLYSLYIRDRHARETEPYLSTEIHKAAMRKNIIIGYEEFIDVDNYGSANIIKTGRFRYVATRSSGGYPIGVFRMRYRAHTRDCGKGIAAEQNRFDQWSAMLEKIK